MRPIFYAVVEVVRAVEVVAILDMRKQWRRQSGTAKVGTRSDPLPALAGL